jgi:hypothetical protein
MHGKYIIMQLFSCIVIDCYILYFKKSQINKCFNVSFQGDLLLKCANECLDTEGEMNRIWHKTCPYFGQPIYLDK